MKRLDLIKSYDRIQPDPAVFDGVWDRIVHEVYEKPVKKRFARRRVLLVAACIALLVACSGIGYAAIVKWSLPDPTPYELTENGTYDVLQANDYDTVEEAPAPLSDEDFIAQAVQLLQTVGLSDVDTQQMTVVRQENLYWNRTEAEVRFTQDKWKTSVTFDAQSGTLLSLFGIDYLPEGASACQTEEQAAQLATRYYQMLPVPQGYVLTGHTEYDEQYWSFSFCREVMDGLYNDYEMVRVAVNPQSGRLTGCNVFSVPLLDDHAPEDVPLTQEQAEQAAKSCEKLDLTNYVLQSAEVRVALPNWNYTDKGTDPNLQASDVTRLAWSLVYERPQSEFADMVKIDIDYYTGEILGGDATK